jgi:phage tail protein X
VAAGVPRVEVPPPHVEHEMASAAQREAPPAVANGPAAVVAPAAPPAAPRPADLVAARAAQTPVARATDRILRPLTEPRPDMPQAPAGVVAPKPEVAVPAVAMPAPAAPAVAPRPERRPAPVPVQPPRPAPEQVQQPPPAPEQVQQQPPPPEGEGAVVRAGSVPPEGMRVEIVEGDDLTHIARRYYGYDSRDLLVAIQEANPSLVDIDLVPAGFTLVLPPPPPVPSTAAEAAPAIESAPAAATP